MPGMLHFISTRTGRAAIVGIPAKGTSGRYRITITAANQLGATSQLRPHHPPPLTAAQRSG
jgi:hypothetical protein